MGCRHLTQNGLYLLGEGRYHSNQKFYQNLIQNVNKKITPKSTAKKQNDISVFPVSLRAINFSPIFAFDKKSRYSVTYGHRHHRLTSINRLYLKLLFKCFMLQKWFHINSDPELENQINDHLSLKKFLSLPFSKPAPDHSTYSRFRSKSSKEAMDQVKLPPPLVVVIWLTFFLQSLLKGVKWRILEKHHGKGALATIMQRCQPYPPAGDLQIPISGRIWVFLKH